MTVYYQVYIFWLLSNLSYVFTFVNVCIIATMTILGTVYFVGGPGALRPMCKQWALILLILLTIFSLLILLIPNNEELSKIIGTARNIEIIQSYPEPLITMLEEKE